MRMARRRVNAAPLPPSPLVGEGRGGGSSGVAWPCHTGAAPTRDPPPQGGGEQRARIFDPLPIFHPRAPGKGWLRSHFVIPVSSSWAAWTGVENRLSSSY